MSTQTALRPQESVSHLGSISYLDAVEEHLRNVFDKNLPEGAHHPSVLIEAAKNLCLAGGKRIRPRLVYLFGQTLDANPEHLLSIATAAELMHSASLLHDDVVDESYTRRGRETANSRWGNKTAVLTGDLVLALAIMQLKNCPMEVHTSSIEVVADMSRASMLEVHARGNLETKLQDWLEIAKGKTGRLFAWCGHATASLVNDTKAAKHFADAAMHLGVAFQMADDIRDILGIDKTKDQFSDLRNRNPSFPLLEAMEIDRNFRERIYNLWQEETVNPEEATQIGHAILKTPAIRNSFAKLKLEIDSALEILTPYKNTPCGDGIAKWVDLLWNGLCPDNFIE